jgi:hypothetical protein
MKLPKSWDDISLDMYSRLYPLIIEKPKTAKEQLNLNYRRIMSVVDCEMEDVDRLTVDEVTKFNNLITSEMPTKIYKRFIINGYRYEFNLDANTLNAGGYASIMSDIQDKPYNILYKIMFNIATPIKLTPLGYKPYEFEKTDIHKRMEEFKDMPISVANPIAVFFCNLSKALTEVTEDYLSNQMKKMQTSLNHLKEDLRDTDG